MTEKSNKTQKDNALSAIAFGSFQLWVVCLIVQAVLIVSFSLLAGHKSGAVLDN